MTLEQLSGTLGKTIMGLGLATIVTIFIAVYVYVALAWMTIAKKLKHPYPWLSWIPFANIALILQLGGFHWALTFLILVPFLGWIAIFILSIIATWKAFVKRKYPGWFSLASLIPQIGAILYLIAIGFVAWKDK